MKNLALIGMPAVGKSTVGVLLAKRLGWSFVDTDLLIQVGESKKLRQIIRDEGMERFCEIEQEYLLALQLENHVIATGGSAVYGDRAMVHLKTMATVFHLDLKPRLLEKRLGDLSFRGVVIAPDQNIEMLYRQRNPLYLRYADATIACDNLSIDQVVNRMERKFAAAR